jgi:hypothetical protein
MKGNNVLVSFLSLVYKINPVENVSVGNEIIIQINVFCSEHKVSSFNKKRIDFTGDINSNDKSYRTNIH